jgi:hypothetical protein
MRTKTKVPKCPECKKSTKVFLVTYRENGNPNNPKDWEGYECERCNCVVKEIYNRDAED